MKKTSLFLLLSGPIAALCYLLHDILGNLYYPGYQVMTQAVSDLTAVTSPARWIAQPFSLLYGIFSVLCILLICILCKSKVSRLQKAGMDIYAVMNLISAVGYTLFPLTDNESPNSFPNTMHIVVTVLVVVTSIVSLILLAAGGRAANGDRTLSVASAIAFIMMLFGAMGSNLLPAGIFGLVERCSTYAAVLFTAFLGIHFFQRLRKEN